MGQGEESDMAVTPTAPIKLDEFRRQSFPREAIPYALGEELYRRYSEQVGVEFPSPVTNNEWRLTNQGWVGYIPLRPDFGLELGPKVDVGNLFRMLEYAYNLQLQVLDAEVVGLKSLAEVYERLAHILALRVLDRARKGYYRSYIPETDRLPYIRGRMEMQRLFAAPWETRPVCRFEDHTADNQENQILCWTLGQLTRSGVCSKDTLPAIRQAYRTLQNAVTPTPCQAQDCIDRLYSRLNDDYRPLHALCRFFLEHSGPSHLQGDHHMLPFLVDMAQLFERFVARWLEVNAGQDLRVRTQYRFYIDPCSTVAFIPDLALYRSDGEIVRVLDTKYKAPAQPEGGDIAQVIAYAEARHCPEAVLIYPTVLEKPLDAKVGDIRVRSMTFSIAGDLERAGKSFLAQLGISN
jgi:5-methylcytosine-specific restriction enzyme subunit McrC